MDQVKKSVIKTSNGSEPDHRVDRRKFLATGVAALAGAVVTPRITWASADRAGKSYLVSLPDASVEKVVQEVIAPIFKKKYNATLVTQQASSSASLSALRVQRRQPSFLAVTLDLSYAIQAIDEGLADPVTDAKIPNLSAVVAPARAHNNTLTSFLLSTDTLCFNTTAWPKAPIHYSDIFAPGKVERLAAGVPSTNIGLEFLAAAASASNGKKIADATNDLEEGIRYLSKFKHQIKGIFSRGQEVLPLLASGELGTCFGKTRFLTDWVLRGAGVDCTIPAEGAFYSLNCLVPVHNSPNPELSMAFVDLMLSPEIQALWPTRIGSAAVNKNVVASTPAALKRIVPSIQDMQRLTLLPEVDGKRMADLSRLFNELVVR